MSVLLQKKKEALDRRERSIKARESDIQAAEARISEELTKLEQVRNEMRQAMQDLDAQQLEEVERLVKMFEKMRGKKAAAILEETDREIAVEVLRRMREKQAERGFVCHDARCCCRVGGDHFSVSLQR